MRKKSKIRIITIILGIFLALSSINEFNIIEDQKGNVGTIENQDEGNIKSLKISDIYVESFIHIDGRIPGNWSATTSYDWCNGDGSWGNPYIIENVTIDASSSPTGSGILIEDSKKEYFIIRNCTVYNSGHKSYDGGMKLENTNNGTIINNNCSDNENCGIFLDYNCINNTILNNLISNNSEHGIYLKVYCNENTISGNTVYTNDGNGIFVWNSDNNIISRNNVSNNFNCGIIIDESNNTIVRENLANSNEYTGILLSDSNINNISRNIVNQNNKGIHVAYYSCFNNVINNTLEKNSDFGIVISQYSNYNVISGNLIIYIKWCIDEQLYCKGNIIEGNTCIKAVKEFPFVIVSFTIISAVGGIGGVAVVIFLWRKRKRASNLI